MASKSTPSKFSKILTSVSCFALTVSSVPSYTYGGCVDDWDDYKKLAQAGNEAGGFPTQADSFAENFFQEDCKLENLNTEVIVKRYWGDGKKDLKDYVKFQAVEEIGTWQDRWVRVDIDGILLPTLYNKALSAGEDAVLKADSFYDRLSAGYGEEEKEGGDLKGYLGVINNKEGDLADGDKYDVKKIKASSLLAVSDKSAEKDDLKGVLENQGIAITGSAKDVKAIIQKAFAPQDPNANEDDAYAAALLALYNKNVESIGQLIKSDFQIVLNLCEKNADKLGNLLAILGKEENSVSSALFNDPKREQVKNLINVMLRSEGHLTNSLAFIKSALIDTNGSFNEIYKAHFVDKFDALVQKQKTLLAKNEVLAGILTSAMPELGAKLFSADRDHGINLYRNIKAIYGQLNSGLEGQFAGKINDLLDVKNSDLSFLKGLEQAEFNNLMTAESGGKAIYALIFDNLFADEVNLQDKAKALAAKLVDKQFKQFIKSSEEAREAFFGKIVSLSQTKGGVESVLKLLQNLKFKEDVSFKYLLEAKLGGSKDFKTKLLNVIEEDIYTFTENNSAYKDEIAQYLFPQAQVSIEVLNKESNINSRVEFVEAILANIITDNKKGLTQNQIGTAFNNYKGELNTFFAHKVEINGATKTIFDHIAAALKSEGNVKNFLEMVPEGAFVSYLTDNYNGKNAAFPFAKKNLSWLSAFTLENKGTILQLCGQHTQMTETLLGETGTELLSQIQTNYRFADFIDLDKAHFVTQFADKLETLLKEGDKELSFLKGLEQAEFNNLMTAESGGKAIYALIFDNLFDDESTLQEKAQALAAKLVDKQFKQFIAVSSKARDAFFDKIVELAQKAGGVDSVINLLQNLKLVGDEDFGCTELFEETLGGKKTLLSMVDNHIVIIENNPDYKDTLGDILLNQYLSDLDDLTIKSAPKTTELYVKAMLDNIKNNTSGVVTQDSIKQDVEKYLNKTNINLSKFFGQKLKIGEAEQTIFAHIKDSLTSQERVENFLNMVEEAAFVNYLTTNHKDAFPFEPNDLAWLSGFSDVCLQLIYLSPSAGYDLTIKDTILQLGEQHKQMTANLLGSRGPELLKQIQNNYSFAEFIALDKAHFITQFAGKLEPLLSAGNTDLAFLKGLEQAEFNNLMTADSGGKAIYQLIFDNLFAGDDLQGKAQAFTAKLGAGQFKTFIAGSSDARNAFFGKIVELAQASGGVDSVINLFKNLKLADEEFNFEQLLEEQLGGEKSFKAQLDANIDSVDKLSTLLANNIAHKKVIVKKVLPLLGVMLSNEVAAFIELLGNESNKDTLQFFVTELQTAMGSDNESQTDTLDSASITNIFAKASDENIAKFLNLNIVNGVGQQVITALFDKVVDKASMERLLDFFGKNESDVYKLETYLLSQDFSQESLNLPIENLSWIECFNDKKAMLGVKDFYSNILRGLQEEENSRAIVQSLTTQELFDTLFEVKKGNFVNKVYDLLVGTSQTTDAENNDSELDFISSLPKKALISLFSKGPSWEGNSQLFDLTYSNLALRNALLSNKNVDALVQDRINNIADYVVYGASAPQVEIEAVLEFAKKALKKDFNSLFNDKLFNNKRKSLMDIIISAHAKEKTQSIWTLLKRLSQKKSLDTVALLNNHTQIFNQADMLSSLEAADHFLGKLVIRAINNNKKLEFIAQLDATIKKEILKYQINKGTYLFDSVLDGFFAAPENYFSADSDSMFSAEDVKELLEEQAFSDRFVNKIAKGLLYKDNGETSDRLEQYKSAAKKLGIEHIFTYGKKQVDLLNSLTGELDNAVKANPLENAKLYENAKALKKLTLEQLGIKFKELAKNVVDGEIKNSALLKFILNIEQSDLEQVSISFIDEDHKKVAKLSALAKPKQEEDEKAKKYVEAIKGHLESEYIAKAHNSVENLKLLLGAKLGAAIWSADLELLPLVNSIKVAFDKGVFYSPAQARYCLDIIETLVPAKHREHIFGKDIIASLKNHAGIRR